MNLVDIWRSLLIGQSVWVVVLLGCIYTMRLLEKPHLGFVIGLTTFSLGDFAAIIYIVASTLNRMGQPPNWQVWLATIAIISESFGCVLIAAHLFFQNPTVLVKLKTWFQK